VNRNRYVSVSPDVAARMIGGEMMVLSVRDATLFVLNGTAAALWESFDGTAPLAEIVARRICSEFDVDGDEALRDAEQLVADLASRGLLVLADSPTCDTGAQQAWRSK
jgi:hypothetical protein